MIKVDVINFVIVVAFVTIWRFLVNVVAALIPQTAVGQALSLIAT